MSIPPVPRCVKKLAPLNGNTWRRAPVHQEFFIFDRIHCYPVYGDLCYRTLGGFLDIDPLMNIVFYAASLSAERRRAEEKYSRVPS